MNETIKFPALVIGKNNVDKINYKYLVSDRRYISVAYRNVIIFDSSGNCFDIKKVIKTGDRINVLYSLKLLGIIVKVLPVLNRPVYIADLDQIKQELIKIILANPAKFNTLSNTKDLIKSITDAKDPYSLINVF